MNDDQRRNLENLIDALASALYGAWSYLHVLRGLHRGGKAAPEALKEHAHVIDELWRALFDALFAQIGTILDRTPSTESLPTLLTRYRRYAANDPAARRFCGDLEAKLRDPKVTSLKKLEAWRMKVVAHRTPEGRQPDFYTNNQMHLDEIAESLSYLECILNEFGVNVLNTMHIIESDTTHLTDRGELILTRLAGRA